MIWADRNLEPKLWKAKTKLRKQNKESYKWNYNSRKKTLKIQKSFYSLYHQSSHPETKEMSLTETEEG